MWTAFPDQKKLCFLVADILWRRFGIGIPVGKKQLTAEFSRLKFSVGSPKFYPFSGLLLKYGPKGRLISKCPFVVCHRLDQNTNEIIWQIFALEFEKGSNYKIKALYNIFNTLDTICKLYYIIIRKCLYFVDFTTF